MVVIEWLAALDWGAILTIILVDILLGGDNAVVIALACRGLPPKLRRQGILWGTFGAIALRVVLIMFAMTLLKWPFLKLVGGLLLLWIGVKLLLPEEGDEHDGIQASDKLMSAIKTIIVADFVMSVDNVIAIAGAAEQAQEGQRLGLVIFGLLVSIPLIIWGSQIVLKLLERFPIIITAGGALLGWIAGGLIATDPIIKPYLAAASTIAYYGLAAAGAILVVAIAKWLTWRQSVARSTQAS